MALNKFDPNSAASPGNGIYGLPYTLEESKVVLLPVPVEMTTSYGGGTALGPDAILQASKQVDLYDASAGRIYEAGLFMMPESPHILRLNREGRKLALPIIRRGGNIDGAPKLKRVLVRVNSLGDRVNEAVYSAAAELIARGKIVGVVGGDHSVPFGLMQAYAECFPGMGVLHFDAHCDLRVAYEGFTWSHASIMYNVVSRIARIRRLVQVGIRDFCEQEMELVRRSRGRVVTFFDENLQRQKFEGRQWKSIVAELLSPLPRNVYISFDIDGLNPSLCPHTGTPVPGGLTFEEAVYAIAAVAKSGRCIVGFDLTEVAPGPEGGEWDANVGARLLYKMIGHTLLSQKCRRK
ncbi:MAG: agmatinase family protein [Terriglobia bacterium]